MPSILPAESTFGQLRSTRQSRATKEHSCFAGGQALAVPELRAQPSIRRGVVAASDGKPVAHTRSDRLGNRALLKNTVALPAARRSPYPNFARNLQFGVASLRRATANQWHIPDRIDSAIARY